MLEHFYGLFLAVEEIAFGAATTQCRLAAVVGTVAQAQAQLCQCLVQRFDVVKSAPQQMAGKDQAHPVTKGHAVGGALLEGPAVREHGFGRCRFQAMLLRQPTARQNMDGQVVAVDGRAEQAGEADLVRHQQASDGLPPPVGDMGQEVGRCRRIAAAQGEAFLDQFYCVREQSIDLVAAAVGHRGEMIHRSEMGTGLAGLRFGLADHDVMVVQQSGNVGKPRL